MLRDSFTQQLLHLRPGSTRDRLRNRASSTPNYLMGLLEEGRNALLVSPADALLHSDLAIELSEIQPDYRLRAQAWRLRAQALRLLGRHEEALLSLTNSSDAAEKGGDPGLAAQVQIGSIDSLGMLGRVDEAIALSRRLESELRNNNLEIEAAKVLVNVGGIYYRRDDYVSALDCYERALPVLEAGGDRQAVARVRTNCANNLIQLNRIPEALDLYARARQAFSEEGAEMLAAVVEANEGYLRYISGEHPAALASLSRARQVFTERMQPLEIAKCDADMADAYHELNLGPESLECYDRAIAVFAAIPLDYERARAEVGRASVLQVQGEFAAALESLSVAESLFRKQKNRFQLAHVQLVRAEILKDSGDFDTSVNESRSAATALTRLKLPGWAAEARYLIAERALLEGPGGIPLMRAVSRAATAHSRRWLACRAENQLGRYYHRTGSLTQAIRHFRAAVSELEVVRAPIVSEEMHVSFLRDKLPVYQDLVGGLLERGRRRDVAEALETVERSKSRLLLERLQTGLDQPDLPTNSEERIRLSELRSELCRAYYQIHSFDENSPQRRLGSTSSTGDGLLELEHNYRLALRDVELFEQQPGIRSHITSSVALTGSLQEALAPDETLVEFFEVNGTIHAFLLSKNALKVHRNVTPVAEITYLMRRLRFQMQRAEMIKTHLPTHAEQMLEAMLNVLSRLYELLWKPIRASVKTEKLVLVPHGILHGLPFHALRDRCDYLLDRCEIVYAPSAAVWRQGVVADRVRVNDTRRGESALIMGVPAAGLEHVASEIAALKRLLPEAETFCGDQATIENFRKYAPGSRWIHLATHALYRDDNPLFSGLRFAGGWLLARDLYDMRLDCDLATLSACRTGSAFVEPGDELFGLTRGFLSAGARSLAVSLWPADDATTAHLMTRFYDILMKGGSRASALRAAQQETREVFPHPYYWAAFALVGDR